MTPADRTRFAQTLRNWRTQASLLCLGAPLVVLGPESMAAGPLWAAAVGAVVGAVAVSMDERPSGGEMP